MTTGIGRPRSDRVALLGAIALLAAVVAPSPAVAGGGFASTTDWSTMPDPERDPFHAAGAPPVGTLRVMRYGFDGRPMSEDRGSMIGWAAQAAKGNYVEQRTPDEKATLEIINEAPSNR